MAKFNTEGVPQWALQRVLSFLNRAKDPKDIAGDGVPNPEDQLDPDNWEDYSIGLKVAERILEKRDGLPFKRFTEVSQLEEVSGLGADKFNDLVKAFNISSAEAFLQSMYNNGVISSENWRLYHFTNFIEDTEEYRNVTRVKSNFREYVTEEVINACTTKTEDFQKCRLVGRTLESSYIDTYSNSALDTNHALAFWFYRFSADNFFSYDVVFRETSQYFAHHDGGNWEMYIHFFKGFQHEVLSDGIVPRDLPVVTCEAEQSISIWTSALYD